MPKGVESSVRYDFRRMGLSIELQDEWGGILGSTADPRNLLASLLPPVLDKSSLMLGHIDPYANTTFNNLQISQFLVEWAGVSSRARTAEKRELVSAIEAMAQRVRDEVHLYLKFIGD
jgi:hypothetical protein